MVVWAPWTDVLVNGLTIHMTACWGLFKCLQSSVCTTPGWRAYAVTPVPETVLHQFSFLFYFMLIRINCMWRLGQVVTKASIVKIGMLYRGLITKFVSTQKSFYWIKKNDYHPCLPTIYQIILIIFANDINFKNTETDLLVFWPMSEWTEYLPACSDCKLSFCHSSSRCWCPPGWWFPTDVPWTRHWLSWLALIFLSNPVAGVSTGSDLG